LKRLLEKTRQLFLIEAEQRILFAIATHQNDSCRGTQSTDLPECAFPVQKRHRHIEEYDVDFLLVITEELNRLETVSCRSNTKSELLQYFPGDFPNVFFVVNDENGGGPAPRIVAIGLR